MGGKVFSATLSTPRMPPDIYDLVFATTHSILQKHFSRVESPIEAPGKDSYGDIDILVFGPLQSSLDSRATPVLEVTENLAKLLGATKWVKNSAGTNFAIPWPSLPEKDDERYIQLDIHVCKAEKELQWEMFHTAHGDLWNILGSTVCQF